MCGASGRPRPRPRLLHAVQHPDVRVLELGVAQPVSERIRGLHAASVVVSVPNLPHRDEDGVRSLTHSLVLVHSLDLRDVVVQFYEFERHV